MTAAMIPADSPTEALSVAHAREITQAAAFALQLLHVRQAISVSGTFDFPTAQVNGDD